MKVRGLRWVAVQSEQRHKQQRLDDDGEETNAYLELFQIELALEVIGKFVGFSVMSWDDDEEVEGSVVRLVRVDIRATAVVRCLTE